MHSSIPGVATSQLTRTWLHHQYQASSFDAIIRHETKKYRHGRWVSVLSFSYTYPHRSYSDSSYPNRNTRSLLKSTYVTV